MTLSKLSIVILAFITISPSLIIAQNDINYSPDPGIRIDSATTRKAVFRNDSLFVYYGQALWTGDSSGRGLAIATDQPDFNNFTKVNIDSFPLYNYALLPDSVTRRRYFKNLGDTISSESSTDGWNSSLDTDVRYVLDPSDNSTFGVHSTVVDAVGEIHLYYMGDMGVSSSAMNNIRHAVSTDGGDSFTFQDNNICGDLGWGGFTTYVDPDVVLMSNGDIRLYAMNPHGYQTPPSVFDTIAHTIHCFYSSDNGYTFSLDQTLSGSDTIVQCSDFSVHSVHDPKAVELPDGRLKVFINGMTFVGDSTYQFDIYSFTSLIPLTNLSESEPEHNAFTIYPNPTTETFAVSENGTLRIIDLLGREHLNKKVNANEEIEISDLPAGSYIVSMNNYTRVLILE